MNNDTKKIFVLLLAAFIIFCAFVPSLNPLPTVNNSTSKTPLIQLFTDSINSSNPSDVEGWVQDVTGTSGYADKYMVPLDTLIFGVLGVLLVMFLIGVIILIVSKKSGVFAFIRIIAILNTMAYASLIALTLYQNNKLSNDTWGVSSNFIKISPSTGAYIGFIASLVLAFIATRERLQVADKHDYNTQNRQNPPIINEQIRTQTQAQNSVNISEKMNGTMIVTKGKVNNFLANQKEKIRTEYETVEKDFKGLGLDDIISASREFCYRNRILKYIMPYMGITLIIQTVIVGMTMLFGLHSYSRFSAISYIINSDIFFVVVVALCLIKKNYLVVAIYETLLIVLNFILYGGFNGGFIGTFAWINILVMIVIDVYAIKMSLKNRELNKEAYQHIEVANNIQEQILCQSCGKYCNKDVNFCNECGNKLS
jgi:gas vesicle protein